MSTINYFPSTEDAQIVWLSHYALKLPVNGPSCGISAEEITSTQQDIAYWTWLLQYWHPAIQRDAKEATAHKQLIIAGVGNSNTSQPEPTAFPNPPPAPVPGMQKRLSSQIVRIKASPNYNDVIGHDLGIIAASNSVEHLTPEPTVTVELGETGSRIYGGDWNLMTGLMYREARASGFKCPSGAWVPAGLSDLQQRISLLPEPLAPMILVPMPLVPKLRLGTPP